MLLLLPPSTLITMLMMKAIDVRCKADVHSHMLRAEPVCACVCVRWTHTHTHTLAQLHIKHIKLRFINNVSNLWFGSCWLRLRRCCPVSLSLSLTLARSCSLSLALSPSLLPPFSACHFRLPFFFIIFYCLPRTHLGKVQSTHHQPTPHTPPHAPCQSPPPPSCTPTSWQRPGSALCVYLSRASSDPKR